MKPFNLEAAKSGAPIVTRDGREARFIGYEPNCREYSRVLVHVKGVEYVYAYSVNGRMYENSEDETDLFMKPQKRIVWVNLYAIPAVQGELKNFTMHQTEGEAISVAGKRIGTRSIATAVPVEIKE